MTALPTGSSPHPAPHRSPRLARDPLGMLARRCVVIVPDAWSLGHRSPSAAETGASMCGRTSVGPPAERRRRFAHPGPGRYRRPLMRRVTLLIGLGLLVACRHDALPPEMTIEHVVTELAPPLPPGARVAGPSAAGGRRAVLQPGYHAGCGAPHDALVTPPGTAVRVRVDVPPDGVLRFSTGVDGDKQRHPDWSGADFRVTVDGQRAFARVVNPATRRKDRCWIDGSVDLRAWVGRSVDVIFETRAELGDHPLAGTAAGE